MPHLRSALLRLGTIATALAVVLPTGQLPAAAAPTDPAGDKPVAASAGPTAVITSSAPVPAKTSAKEKRRVDRVKAPKLDWFESARGSGFYLTTVKLPLDYDHPKGPKIEVALGKRPASDPKHKIGTLFVNPGGPGGSGVDLASQAERFLSKKVLARFDIVGFDPRGTNYGTTVRCLRGFREQTKILPDMSSIPLTSAARKTYLAAAKKYATACSTRGRKLSTAMSTAEVARDMDVLRRAVGDRKLSYLGFSYGSYLGEVYANLFPNRFRALAIDGVVDPVAWQGNSSNRSVPMFARLKSADGTWTALSTGLARCKAAGPDYCLLKDPMATFKKLAATLRTGPILSDGEPLATYDSFMDWVTTALYSPEGIETLIWYMAGLVDFVDNPSATATASSRPVSASSLRALSFTPTEFPYQNDLDAYSSVICTDSLQPKEPKAWPRAIDKASVHAPYFSAAWGWSDVQCATRYWTARDEDSYRGGFSRNTAKPVLIVGNYFDPATPYEGALAASDLMPNSYLIRSDSWGHTAYGTSNCVTKGVDAYLIAGTKPATTTCKGDFQPFTTRLDAELQTVPRGLPKLKPQVRDALAPVLHRLVRN